MTATLNASRPRRLLSLLAMAMLAPLPTLADEGQWMPQQLPQLAPRLKQLGVQLPARQLADMTRHPLSAMVSLGGCSGAFVSAEGLVITSLGASGGGLEEMFLTLTADDAREVAA